MRLLSRIVKTKDKAFTLMFFFNSLSLPCFIENMVQFRIADKQKYCLANVYAKQKCILAGNQFLQSIVCLGASSK